MKYKIFKNKPLTAIMQGLPRQYAEKIKPSQELASAIYYTKDKMVITSNQVQKTIEKLGDCSCLKYAIAYNFSGEAIELLKKHDFRIIHISNFTWTDDLWKNRHQ